MTAYYNEIDPFAAQWLRNLIAAGHIPPGEVDTRSVTEVQPDDVRGFTQCHFFAGIAGWAHALRLAGWPDNRPVWTGSCPCQPFSAAGRQRGTDDERHLWPEFARLIRECRPPVVAGEQVASALGRTWLANVRADLEAMGYAVGAADLCAAGVGAPHIRQRLWWVGHPIGAGLEGHHGDTHAGGYGQGTARSAAKAGVPDDFWRDLAWLACRDGKARPTQPGLFPLAHGIPGRVGRLRAYGNAIVPQVAAEFVSAVMEATR